MPRGVYARKKKSAPRKPAKRAAPSTRRQRTVDIPTISRSAIRSSVSNAPTPGGLVSKIAMQSPAVAGDQILDLGNVDLPFAVFRGASNEGATNDFEIDWDTYTGRYSTEQEAFDAAREQVKNDIEDNDDDESEVFVVQVIGRVVAKKPDEPQYETVVSRVGGPL